MQATPTDPDHAQALVADEKLKKLNETLVSLSSGEAVAYQQVFRTMLELQVGDEANRPGEYADMVARARVSWDEAKLLGEAQKALRAEIQSLRG